MTASFHVKPARSQPIFYVSSAAVLLLGRYTFSIGNRDWVGIAALAGSLLKVCKYRQHNVQLFDDFGDHFDLLSEARKSFTKFVVVLFVRQYHN